MAAVPVPLEQPVPWHCSSRCLAEEQPIPKGAWPVALPSSSPHGAGALGQALQWQSSAEQLCSGSAVLRIEVLLKSLPRGNNRQSQVLPYLLFQAQSRVSSLCLSVGLSELVLAPQLEPGTGYTAF